MLLKNYMKSVQVSQQTSALAMTARSALAALHEILLSVLMQNQSLVLKDISVDRQQQSMKELQSNCEQQNAACRLANSMCDPLLKAVLSAQQLPWSQICCSADSMGTSPMNCITLIETHSDPTSWSVTGIYLSYALLAWRCTTIRKLKHLGHSGRSLG